MCWAGGNLEAGPADPSTLHSSSYSPWVLCKMMDLSASLFFIFPLTLKEFKSLKERARHVSSYTNKWCCTGNAEQGVCGRGERRPRVLVFGKGLPRSHGCDVGVKLVGIAKIGALLQSLGCFQ